MQYFLLSQSKVKQCIQHFDINRRHDVVLMVMADQPEKEIAARDSLLGSADRLAFTPPGFA